jgi:iron uptake system EfeUOB component EfeO/EfeM
MKSIFFMLIALFAAYALPGCGGEGSGDATAAASQQRLAGARYRAYLVEHAHWMVDWTAKLDHEIASGQLNWAQPDFAISRVHFGSIEAVAVPFDPASARVLGSLGFRRGSGLPPFLRVERSLFRAETTAGLSGEARHLVRAARVLQHRLRTMPLMASALLRDGAALMSLVATAKMAGRGAPFSELDLVGISANVEGAEAAAKVAEPCLAPRKLQQLRKAFEVVYAEVEQLGFTAREAEPGDPEAGAGMHEFSELTRGERRHLTTHLNELSRALAHARAELSEARGEGC